MVLYHQAAAPASPSRGSEQALWPEPIETVWQNLPGGRETSGIYKRPDITVSDRLFMGAVLNIPAERRPWGIVTWLADYYRTSRETVYTIGKHARQGCSSSQHARLRRRPP